MENTNEVKQKKPIRIKKLVILVMTFGFITYFVLSFLLLEAKVLQKKATVKIILLQTLQKC